MSSSAGGLTRFLEEAAGDRQPVRATYRRRQVAHRVNASVSINKCPHTNSPNDDGVVRKTYSRKFRFTLQR